MAFVRIVAWCSIRSKESIDGYNALTLWEMKLKSHAKKEKKKREEKCKYGQKF